jgi:hypothetical protein
VQVGDDRRVRDAGVRAADLGRQVGMGHRQTAHVRLVDDGLVVRRVRVAVVLPVEERVDHDRLGRLTAGVELVDPPGCGEPVVEQRLGPVDLALDRLRVRVEQQLGRVRPQPPRRVARPVHPEAVALARPDAREVAVPDETIYLGQLDARLGQSPAALATRVVEQAELHTLGDLGEQREVSARAVEGRAQRICRARPDFHGRHCRG